MARCDYLGCIEFWFAPCSIHHCNHCNICEIRVLCGVAMIYSEGE